ncbi:uncharacterized protein LOC125234690 [Leguminivora glycinivorella]|uniref:uncharacterized protein LOC125234690 n=1 Tax=Leguminivora glycinivorella TaxID=1035111 RepID=UPI00201067DB|nr:uncharacterized protein LOC125234690 [Leguminivora glycinivorella]
MQLSRNPLNHIRFFLNVQRIVQKCVSVAPYTTTADALDIFTSELLHKHRSRTKNILTLNNLNIRYFTETDNHDVSQMTTERLDSIINELITKNKEKQILQMVQDCLYYRKYIPMQTVKKLCRIFSETGKPEYISILQQYSSKVDPIIYKRNGEFIHYMAKAQCMKGNSDKGLALLKDAYTKYPSLRSLCRIIFNELIQDSIFNRSEASLVIFKKYVIMFSEEFDDYYPLVCFWHLSWSSTWFSDQMLSDDLLKSSKGLRDIVKDKATAFTICILRDKYNEDAVVRLLQSLLKYSMMDEYARVLQILFNYKLRNRDMRGCTEIMRNCETLGISLPSNHQEKYIKLLIQGKDKTDGKPPDFKLKF